MLIKKNDSGVGSDLKDLTWYGCIITDSTTNQLPLGIKRRDEQEATALKNMEEDREGEVPPECEGQLAHPVTSLCLLSLNSFYGLFARRMKFQIRVCLPSSLH